MSVAATLAPVLFTSIRKINALWVPFIWDGHLWNMYHRVWDWIRCWIRCQRWCWSRRIYWGRGYLSFFFAIGPLEVTVTSCSLSSVTPTMGTATGVGAGGIWVKAFAAVMRGGAGNTLVAGWSEEDDKPDDNTSMQLATGVPSIATSSCCMASACSWSASQWTYCARQILLNACRKEYNLKQNRFQ